MRYTHWGFVHPRPRQGIPGALGQWKGLESPMSSYRDHCRQVLQGKAVLLLDDLIHQSIDLVENSETLPAYVRLAKCICHVKINQLPGSLFSMLA